MYHITKGGIWMKNMAIKSLPFYLVFALLIVCLGYFYTPSPKEVQQINPQGLNEIFFIIAVNGAIFLLLLLFSFTGFSLLYSIKFLYSMGESGKVSGYSPEIYYGASFIHGIGEILLVYLVIIFSIAHFRELFLLLKTKSGIQLKHFYTKKLPKYLLIGFILITLSAFAEVLIANNLIQRLVN